MRNHQILVTYRPTCQPEPLSEFVSHCVLRGDDNRRTTSDCNQNAVAEITSKRAKALKNSEFLDLAVEIWMVAFQAHQFSNFFLHYAVEWNLNFQLFNFLPQKFWVKTGERGAAWPIKFHMWNSHVSKGISIRFSIRKFQINLLAWVLNLSY